MVVPTPDGVRNPKFRSQSLRHKFSSFFYADNVALPSAALAAQVRADVHRLRVRRRDNPLPRALVVRRIAHPERNADLAPVPEGHHDASARRDLSASLRGEVREGLEQREGERDVHDAGHGMLRHHRDPLLASEREAGAEGLGRARKALGGLFRCNNDK